EIGLFLLLGLSWRVWSYRAGQTVMAGMDVSLIGLIYCVIPLLQLHAIYTEPQGKLWLCYLMVVVWGTDIGAYLIGRWLGRHKLAPMVSPGKSWEGAWGGLLVAALAGWAMIVLLSLTLTTQSAIMLSVGLSVVAQVGDLIESLFKREAGVKDAGQLIPGHGGLLDRLDSLLFAAPGLFMYLTVTR
ncbi:MAG: phosphatidate cytidylyltransferase, partial [Magnetococcales bacterium]|nr:phosphatidate cytidylyltransferase [Magnetococcales bacterium]